MHTRGALPLWGSTLLNSPEQHSKNKLWFCDIINWLLHAILHRALGNLRKKSGTVHVINQTMKT